MPPAKENGTPPKHCSLQPLKFIICLTNNGKTSKQIFGIFILSKADRKPYGWEFLNFHHFREFIKRMCNCNAHITTLGGEDFEPLMNLTATWIQHSNLANYIWVIHIDATNSGTKGSFPMRAHVKFADKIAQAVIFTKPQSEKCSLEIVYVMLTEAQEKELNMHFPLPAISEQELSLRWLFL